MLLFNKIIKVFLFNLKVLGAVIHVQPFHTLPLTEPFTLIFGDQTGLCSDSMFEQQFVRLS